MIISFGCSNDDNSLIEINNDLIKKFDTHLLNSKSNQADGVDLNDIPLLLDNTMNYQNTIFNYIVTDNRQLSPNESLKNVEYTTPNQLDKHIIDSALNSFMSDDLPIFYYNMNYYKVFISNQIKDEDQKKYLIEVLESFKWSKYSAVTIAGHVHENGLARTHPFCTCFDACMERSIENALDDANWIEWTQFLITAAQTVAWWTASCTWDCL
jgi:ATP-dependent Clp protease adapter protein ClpS